MRRLLVVACGLAGLVIGIVGAQQPSQPPRLNQAPALLPMPGDQAKPKPKRARGARPSPRHKLVSTPRHMPRVVPATFSVVPSQLSYWGNDVDGDCVSAEEAFAKAAWSLMAGPTETFIPSANLTSWAGQHGFLNGANLTDVMDTMATHGLVASDGKTYTDGPYQSVDWTSQATLASAIYQGPVKLGVASAQLDHVVGASNGWVATGFATDTNEDHCVSACGYGPLSYLCGLFSTPVPAGVDGATPGVLIFTWDTVGVMDLASLRAITGEAWVRVPTTPQEPTPQPLPTPIPTPTPTPTPPPGPQTYTITIQATVTLQPAGGGKK